MRQASLSLALLVCLAAVPSFMGAQQPAGPIHPDLHLGRPGDTCSTLRVRAQRHGWRPMAVVADGRPISFSQEPSVLTPNYTGTIVFRDFAVAGDVMTVTFQPFDPDTPDQPETWTRTGTTTINGRLVSLFSPSWPALRMAQVMRHTSWGFDYPMLYWGEVLPEGVAVGSGYFVYVRLASSSLPAVTVRQLAPDVQYSSSIVNIRLDDFAAPRVSRDENDYNFSAVTRKFYEHFEDSYDTIAMTTADVSLSPAAAFHNNLKNEIEGIGEDVGRVSDYGSYGSGGRLASVELFYGPTVTTNEVSAHEAAHQWGAYIDWTRLNGLSRAGHQTEAHDPLMSGGETLLGAVLRGTRRPAQSAAGAWVIERTPEPIRFHPLTLYAMGVLPKEQVPEITLFDSQGQFNDGAATAPAVGTAITGATRTATIYNVIGMLGERSGPVPTEWQRAIVVVSSGRLLSQQEMNYWTYFAQRAADPNATGVAASDGYVSFDAATGWAINMKHEIRPRTGGAIVQALPVDFPDLATTDLRDITLDAPLPTRLDVGQRLRISGRVTATDRSDFIQIQMYLWREGGTVDDAVRLIGDISSSGSFTVEQTLEASHRGRFTVQVYLFWSGAPSQYPRAIVGPITVN